MEAKKTYQVFRFESEVRWKSGRRGVVCSSGKPEIEVSSPPEFKGETGIWTPEDMFVASVNVCTLMTFAAFAQNKGLDVAAYESDAEGVLEFHEGNYRFTEILLHPHIMVKSQDDVATARELIESAHKKCLITNSITAQVKVFPDFRVAPSAGL
ncbi:MAG: OsmC family protein [Acidobacteria bacterium]|nr:OsmC family protein [Acidobacteriota bacterium]MBI1982734.1 OsmC family protein [Acidobacteriota bacterium]